MIPIIINKRLQKTKRLNLQLMSAFKNDNETNRNTVECKKKLAKTVSYNCFPSKCYCINDKCSFSKPTTSSHFFAFGNQEYSRSLLPTKIAKLEDWTKQPKTSSLLFFLHSTVGRYNRTIHSFANFK
jgi:hypothetical protein